MAGMIRFLEDQNDRGTQRLVEYVPRDGSSFVLHKFLSWGPKGQKWMSVPGCCPNDDHRLE